MTSVITDRALGRALVSDALFERLVARIVADEQIERQMAERIMDQALAFLKACADNHGKPLAPSGYVDIGWHTFILYTQEYAAFCERVAGFFIHHVPDDEEVSSSDLPVHALARSVEAIRAVGLVVDAELWLTPDSAKGRRNSCTNLGCGAGPPPNLPRSSEV
jgi:hypothetical protein